MRLNDVRNLAITASATSVGLAVTLGIVIRKVTHALVTDESDEYLDFRRA